MYFLSIIDIVLPIQNSEEPNYVEISAETSAEEKKEEKGFVYQERSGASYHRSFTLPTKVDPDNVKASYKNGVLEIIMPKLSVSRKTSIKIE